MAGLTTHVLDVTSGRPADGVRVRALRVGGRIRPQADRRCRDQCRRPHRQAADERRAGARRPVRAHLPRRGLFPPSSARSSPTRRSSTSSRSASASPIPRRITTCPCSSRRGAIRPIAEAEEAGLKGRPGVAVRHDVGPADPFGFSWSTRCFAAKTPVTRVGFPWISLDSLVRIETYQWVTRTIRCKFFS